MTDLVDQPVDSLDQLLAEKYEPIAVVGVGLRFPGGCESFDDFDTFLREGRSGISPMPADRWDVAAFTPSAPGERGKIHATGGGFLDNVDRFDAGFFNISPKEAQYIDPQQRMVLETAWQALEHANVDPAPLRRGNGGVYIGASSIDYALEISELPYTELDGHLAAGITMFPLSGRLSYFLGWRGPSISVDTACSSSLAALHLAAEGLRRRECDIALCGGVNALHHPRIPVIFSHGQMLAPDGQCKTFDDSADGYVRAEGCGVVVLKRLSTAKADGDRILSVIRGSAVGQDGDSAGLTVPNGAAQELVIRNALAAARLSPGDIQYVEAHGTGTPLGDPIELGAISNVFSQSHTHDTPLLVGSVKTNLGHMEPASGIVGLIKVILQLRSGVIYPHLNLRSRSRRIPWDTYAIDVPVECRPWEAPVRRGVVNSIGLAGTIAAVVLEQAPADLAPPDAPGDPDTERGHLFTLSAKGAVALRGQAEAYQRFLADSPGVDVGSLCYTTNVGRSHHSHRLAAVVRDHSDLAGLLSTATATDSEASAPTPIRKVAFLFSGQGSQYAGMGAGLYRRFPLFRQCVDECDGLFAATLGRSVRSLLLEDPAAPSDIDQTWLTQPALFTLELALARLWMSWGIRPNVVIGHSIGEVVAAALAGVFSLADAVTLVSARGRLMQSVTEPGAMVAVHAAADVVRPMLADRPALALAAVNAPGQCVVSGAAEELDDVVTILGGQGIRVDRLAVSHAFHSPLMREVYDDFRSVLASITFRDPTITLVSNVSGAVARPAEVSTPEYWVRHIGEPVSFLDGMQAVARRGRHAMLEIGPSGTLTALARQCVAADDHRWFVSLRRRDRSSEVTMSTLAALYVAGLSVSWSGYHSGRSRQTVALPTYRFQRKRYWLPRGASSEARSNASTAEHHPLLGREVSTPHGREFVAEYSIAGPAPLGDHVVDNAAVVPAAAVVELLLAVQDEVFGHTGGVVRDLRIDTPPVLTDEPTLLRTHLEPVSAGTVRVRVTGGTAEDAVTCATAVLVETPEGAEGALPGSVAMAAALALAAPEGVADDDRDHDAVYLDLASVGCSPGPRLRLLQRAARYGNTVVAEVANRRALLGEHLPVDVLECAMQAVAVIHPAGPGLTPVSVGSVRLIRRPRGERVRVRALLCPPADARDIGQVDLLLFDGDKPVAELLAVRLARPDRPRPFVHRVEWLRETGDSADRASARHVLVVQADAATGGDLVRSAPDGLAVSLVPDQGELPDKLADSSVTDIAWFWRGRGDGSPQQRLAAESEDNYWSLLTLVQTLQAYAGQPAPRLWLITSGAQQVPGDVPDGTDALTGATMWGFGPVLLAEYPQYRPTLVDIAGPADLAALAREWASARPDEFHIAFRHGRRHVRRMLPGEGTAPSPENYEVQRHGRAVDLVPVTDPRPEPAEIQVRVAAVGPVRGDGTGSACAGVVVASGSDAGFTTGDAVVVAYPGQPRRIITTPAASAVGVPGTAHLAGAAAAVASALAAGTDARQAVAGLTDNTDVTGYGLAEAAEALTELDRGAAAGTVLIHLDDSVPPGPAGSAVTRAAPRRLRPDHCYVVTGGLGGLGLVTARKLVDHGARHLVLVSRSGRAVPEAQAVLDQLRGRAEVELFAADVAQPADIARLVDHLRVGGRPVGGFIHAAGAISKELVARLDWAAIDEQFGPNVYGARLLHEASLAFPEHHIFVLYSSIAAVVGGATQAHYAAANAYLDALARWRVGLGLPGLSINWGVWAQVGMSARLDEQLKRKIDGRGIHFFSPSRALATLADLWAQPVAHRVVGSFDWDRIASAHPAGNALYDRLVTARADNSATSALHQRLVELNTDRPALIRTAVRERVARALHLESPDELDPNTEFISLGLNSLMAVELKSGLEADLRIALPASLTFDHPSPEQLAEFLIRRFVAEHAH
ncbi:type I polyketide synthase [Salinispora cortesiana]|uniref:type I polyketide synthase n=1 Tax=Salinispora cortesiana TaxID=1305843 RepID=UPI00040CD1FA|nr:type I polyketide synthase [Salinispora cortesiana]